jgi:pre-rRNA-processing protein TSR3
MSYILPTIIWRHRKENLKKCSLKNLESREDLTFLTYPKDSLPDIYGYILLTLDAPPLSEKDKDKGLFFIDGTWKYAQTMKNQIPSEIKLEYRSLPGDFKTAYPRKQTLCPDPKHGLATVEALFLSYLITKRNTEGLLDYYHFKDKFLEINELI